MSFGCRFRIDAGEPLRQHHTGLLITTFRVPFVNTLFYYLKEGVYGIHKPDPDSVEASIFFFLVEIR